MVNIQIRLIIFFAAKDGEALYSQQKLGADCRSDHQVLIAKFRLKLEKVGTTTRLFSYGLSQIPYNHTGEVTNRFKGLDLIDRVAIIKSFSDQIRSVAQSCPTLCDPMNRSTPGLPVHHQLPEFTQTHVH